MNAEPNSFAQSFANVHGTSVCAIAFRVSDAGAAFDYVRRKGARPYNGSIGPMEVNIPAIKGIGDSLIYLVGRFDGSTITMSTLSLSTAPKSKVWDSPTSII